jgi:type IV secretory pathway VirB4 component
MLRMNRVLKPWNESGALNAQINLYGFWNEEAFLTKSGDLGIVLRVRGVDYESLDQAAKVRKPSRACRKSLKSARRPNCSTWARRR